MSQRIHRSVNVSIEISCSPRNARRRGCRLLFVFASHLFIACHRTMKVTPVPQRSLHLDLETSPLTSSAAHVLRKPKKRYPCGYLRNNTSPYNLHLHSMPCQSMVCLTSVYDMYLFIIIEYSTDSIVFLPWRGFKLGSLDEGRRRGNDNEQVIKP